MSEGRERAAVATKNATRVSLEAGCTEPDDRWPKPHWVDALQQSGREGAISLLLTVLLALSPLLVGFVGSQFVSAYAIPSRSMDETLKVGDVVLAERLSTILHLPLERGDLVFFSPPPELEDIVSSTGGRVGPRDKFIKRVAAVAGDEVQLGEGGRGVLVNGVLPQSPPLACPREPESKRTRAPAVSPPVATSATTGTTLDTPTPAPAQPLGPGIPASVPAATLKAERQFRPGLPLTPAAGRTLARSYDEAASRTMDPEVAQRVQSLLDAGKVSEGEAAALLRELSPLQREKAEGAAAGVEVNTRRRIFGEERTVDPTQIGVSRVIPEGSLFVLGDCEARSVDSRVWGPLAENRIVARPVVRIWPPDRMGDIDTGGDEMSTGEPMGNFRRAMLRWRQALEAAAIRLPPPDLDAF